jgi:hypothetical protein
VTKPPCTETEWESEREREEEEEEVRQNKKSEFFKNK